ncbi:MAG: hypothetical protein ABJA77_15825, partial [Variovorax sp.]
MNEEKRREGRIAIVDPKEDSRENTARVVRQLGHDRSQTGEFDLLLVNCPIDFDSPMEAVQQVRSLGGLHVPMGLIAAREDLLRIFVVLHARHNDLATRTPPSTKELRNFLSRLLKYLCHRSTLDSPQT